MIHPLDTTLLTLADIAETERHISRLFEKLLIRKISIIPKKKPVGLKVIGCFISYLCLDPPVFESVPRVTCSKCPHVIVIFLFQCSYIDRLNRKHKHANEYGIDNLRKKIAFIQVQRMYVSYVYLTGFVPGLNNKQRQTKGDKKETKWVD